MWEKIRFYFRHSFNDLKVNALLTLFAVLCIGAGVAAIVSLQTLAVMIGNSLQGNLQESNRGDIQFQISSEFLQSESKDVFQAALDNGLLIENKRSFFGQDITEYRLSPGGFEALQAWIDANYPGQITYTYRQPLTDILGIVIGGGTGTAVTNIATGDQATQVTPIVIDAAVYPFYGTVLTLDGTPLRDALQQPTDVVLNDEVARTLGVSVGDSVQINGASEDFVVRGLVATESEVKNPAADTFAALFGFYYLDRSSVALFDSVEPGADLVFLKLDASLDVMAVSASLKEQFPFILATTTEDLRQNYADLSENIDQLVSVMGLVSLLIGSIGIINTMQVIVRRRTVEVAVLKTLGLQANEITVLFLIEALLMGLAGSLIGIAVGWGATFFIRWTAEQLLATSLPFVLAPVPALNGLVVGTLVTMIFGFLPTLTAGQVRPGVVLRPTDNIIPRAGRLRTLLALLVIILVLAVVAQSILGSFVTALGVTVGAFVAAGILYLWLSLMIWLIGRFFPSLGIVDLKISLRQMLAGRTRAAVTLLALVVGVFSLSLITLMAQSVANMMEFGLNEAAGGNVLITVASQAQVNPVLDIINNTPGVRSHDVWETYTLDLVSLEEGDTGQVVSLDELGTRLEVLNERQFGPARGGNNDFQLNWLEILKSELGSIGARRLDQLKEETFAEGRQLTAADSGQPYLVLTDSDVLQAAGINVGDRLTYTFRQSGLLGGLGGNSQPESITFEVIGLIKKPGVSFNMGSTSNSPVYTLADAFPPDRSPNTITIVVDIDEANVPDLRRALAAVPGTFALETAVLNRLLTSLMNAFLPFPTMVAALGLIVGGVVIANSVALTTMERRREIAIMKAVGLQRERVLGMLLLEYAVMGLIGGLIGVGIGLVSLTALLATTGAPLTAVPIGAALLLMLLCVLVALVAALTSAWGASGEKPLNVLRYE